VVLKLLLIGCAVLAAFLPIPRGLVERWYSTGAYPLLQRGLTTLSNAVPLALFDVLLVALTVGTAWVLTRSAHNIPWSTRGLRVGLSLTSLAATLYLAFLFAWGLNYRRVPLTEKLAFEPGRVSSSGAADLAGQAVLQLNRTHAEAHAAGWGPTYAPAPALADAFRRATRELGLANHPVVARPKWSLLDWYFRRAGVAGMTDPFFLETLVASDLLPFERPFVVAHEWSHLAGLGDEGEANFAGWVTCLRGTVGDRYSGWLFAYGELASSLDQATQRDVAARLDVGPRADLLAIRERLLRTIDPRVAAAGWRVYDQYLKANRVTAGAASYSDVVRLMLGVQVEGVSPPPQRLSDGAVDPPRSTPARERVPMPGR
jgi:hypothetical protein